MTKPSSNSVNEPDALGADDPVLVQRCREGDMSAYEQLVGRYRQRVFNVAFGLVRNVDDAQDLTQEAFIKAWRSLKRFKGQSSFYTWIYRIVVNLGIDHQRRRQKRSAVEFDETIKSEGQPGLDSLATHEPLPSRQAERTELRQAIDRALERLSPEHRAVIVMKEFEGLAYQDIARAIGCSIGTVMSRLHYARKNLQKMLKEMR